jgi:hypothetical protein
VRGRLAPNVVDSKTTYFLAPSARIVEQAQQDGVSAAPLRRGIWLRKQGADLCLSQICDGLSLVATRFDGEHTLRLKKSLRLLDL